MDPNGMSMDGLLEKSFSSSVGLLEDPRMVWSSRRWWIG
jgi:hypothetical protein